MRRFHKKKLVLNKIFQNFFSFFIIKSCFKNLLNEKPWDKSANYFKSFQVSAIALLKMVKHRKFEFSDLAKNQNYMCNVVF